MTPRPPVELREIHGPTALGGGRRRAWELLAIMASADFKRAYRGTALGYLWTVARPLLLFVVLLAVFTQVFRIGSQVEHYPVLLLLNIVLYGLFQDATTAGVTAISAQESLVRKTQFPRLVIPLAVVGTATINLGLNMIVVTVFMVAFGVGPLWTWLLFPLVLLLLAVPTVAISMLLSVLYPRFRDTAIIWGLATTVLFYGTPVLYPSEAAPEKVGYLIRANPLTPVFQLARQWLIDPSAPGPGSGPHGGALLVLSGVIYALVVVVAVIVFRREVPRIAERL
ncbi:MAG: ABC transporter permease [Baekduia sp.]